MASATQTATVVPTCQPTSGHVGEKIRTKPCGRTKAEKLETQKGMPNSRNVGHGPMATGVRPARLVLT